MTEKVCLYVFYVYFGTKRKGAKRVVKELLMIAFCKEQFEVDVCYAFFFCME